TLLGEPIEQRDGARKWFAPFCDVLAVVVNELGKQLLDGCAVRSFARRGEATGNERAGAMADETANIIEADRAPAQRRENMIGRAPQVGRGVDERPIEIEDNCTGR